MKLESLLLELDACKEARLWAEGKTLAEAWETCPRADWMLFFARSVCINRRLLISAATECAATALPFMKDERSRAAIETYRAYVRGEASEEQLKKAANVAANAAESIYTYAICAARYAAAAADDENDANSVAKAAYYAAAAATEEEHDTMTNYEDLAVMSEIVRGIITVQDVTDACEKISF